MGTEKAVGVIRRGHLERRPGGDIKTLAETIGVPGLCPAAKEGARRSNCRTCEEGLPRPGKQGDRNRDRRVMKILEIGDHFEGA